VIVSQLAFQMSIHANNKINKYIALLLFIFTYKTNHVTHNKKKSFFDNLFKSKEDWFKDQPNRAQLYSGLISSILTLFALGITIYYSTKNVKLASAQLAFSKQLHVYDSIRISKSESHDLIKEYKENKRDRNQDSIVRLQLQISNSQYLATNKQAIVATKQYLFQKEINDQRFELDKPHLFINYSQLNRDQPKVIFDSTFYNGDFRLQNLGVRAANVIEEKLYAYNAQNKILTIMITKNPANLSGDLIVDFTVPVTESTWNNKSTMYYLIASYLDIKTLHEFRYFFKPSILNGGLQANSPITSIDTVIFLQVMKKYDKSGVYFIR